MLALEIRFGTTLRLLEEMIMNSKENDDLSPLSNATCLKNNYGSVRHPPPTFQQKPS